MSTAPLSRRMTWSPSWVVCLLLSLTLAASASAAVAGRRILLFVGSNTLGEGAVPELAKAYLEQEKKAVDTKISQQGEVIYVSGRMPDGTTAYIEVHATGSGDAFKSFHGDYRAADARCDIGMSSRKIKPAESEALQQKTGCSFTMAGTASGEGSEHPVAMDGIAIIVNKSNPVNRISFSEINAIYSRQLTAWNLLPEWKSSGGGSDVLAIVPVRRKEPSGTLDFFKEKIKPGGTAMEDVIVIPAFVDSRELVASVAATPGGIGFVGQGYAHAPGVKRLQVYNDSPQSAMTPDDAVFPDPAAIQSLSYPLSRLVYLYTPLESDNGDVKPFIRFALSEAGQSFIADKGGLVKIEGSLAEVQDTPKPGMPSNLKPSDGRIILRLHGSNTVGAQCAVNLAFNYLLRKIQTKNPDATIVARITETETPEGERAHAHDLLCDIDGDGTREIIQIRPTGSSDAFRDLASGACDIGMSSRPITDAEKRDLLPVCGNLALPAAQFVLGLDAFAIIVSNENPVEKLTIEQLRRIFLGEITDWADVGGTKGPIQLHARPDRSGTYKRFCDAVLLGRQVAPAAKRHSENAGLTAAVLEDPSGIGFGPMSDVGLAKVLRIGHEGSDNFYKPTEETVRSGRYPSALRRHVYFYVPASPPRSASAEARENWAAAREFAEMTQTWHGQAIVASSGFITESPVADAAGRAKRLEGEPIDEFLDRLNDLEKKSQSADSRLKPALENNEICPQLLFEFNSWTLTPESRNIIDRKLGPWLRMYPQAAQAGLIVEGWADSVGTDEACMTVSLQRAQNVAKYITESLGYPAKAVGKGKSFDPPNTNEANKQQNRRVVIKSAPAASGSPTPVSTSTPRSKKRQ